MIDRSINAFVHASRQKAALLERSPLRYFLLSMLAGAYIGVGIVLILSLGSPLKAAGNPWTATVMGASFAIALTLVLFAGAELFTGNNMILTIGSLSGCVSWRRTCKAWAVCYAGNLAGSLALALLVAHSGLIDAPPLNKFVADIAMAKTGLPPLQLFLRGVLCNMLVCLAIWMASATASEGTKVALIFMCLLAFIGSGFEHSVANMTVLGLGLLGPHLQCDVSLPGCLKNLLYVTAGNMIGGAVFVGACYWWIAKGGGQKVPDGDETMPGKAANEPHELPASLDGVPKRHVGRRVPEAVLMSRENLP
ncbi:MAG: formate/nitrite transporter family protein [Planctomycetes bacterium]|nr:formate/nitrite transporter family protein [Planctomycetota bacterium]